MVDLTLMTLLDCIHLAEWVRIEEAESDEIYYEGLSHKVPENLWDKQVVWLERYVDGFVIQVEDKYEN